MKSYSLFALLLSGTCLSTSAFAQTPTQFIKKVYADHLNEDLISVDAIRLHAAKELRGLILQRDAIAERHLGDMCEWVEYAFPLIPGNDYDTRLNQMKFTQLSNGRVRAQGSNFGERFSLDFEVSCKSNDCKIENIYTPQNYKNQMRQIVRAGTC